MYKVKFDEHGLPINEKLKLDWTNEYLMLGIACIGMALVLIGWLLYNQGYMAGAEMCNELINNSK